MRLKHSNDFPNQSLRSFLTVCQFETGDIKARSVVEEADCALQLEQVAAGPYFLLRMEMLGRDCNGGSRGKGTVWGR